MMRGVGVFVALVAGVSSALGVSLCDYRSPTTEFLQGKASFFYQHADDPATPGIELSEGVVTFDGRRQVDSERAGFTLGTRGEARVQHVGLIGGRVEGTGAVRQYLAPTISLFTYGGLDVAWDTAYSQPWVEAQAGLGYGRFYNVTPLVRALQLEEEFLSRGLLTAAFPAEFLLRLAAVIGEGAEAQTFPEWMARVVKVIEDELGSQLDTPILFLVENLLRETRQERYCGWTVQGGFAYRVLDPKGDSRDLLLSLALDAALAPERDSQLLLRTRLSGPYWITDQYTLGFEVSLERRVERNLTFSALYNLFLDKPRGQRPAGTQKAVFQLELGLEKVGLNLKMEFFKTAEALTWKQAIVLSSTAYLW